MKLYELGIRQAQEGLAKGDFTSVELTRAIIDRVREADGDIGAYLTFDEEGALELAKANPKAVPIAVKDLINVKGQPCTCASKILKGYVSPYDATVIANMKAANFIPAGRVNMDEFAMGSSTANSGLGVTRQRGGRRRESLHCGARNRHGRVDSPARELLRMRRREADVRAREPLRRDGVRKLPRSGGTDDQDR